MLGRRRRAGLGGRRCCVIGYQRARGPPEPVGEHVVPYVNRLSDLLFVLSRWVGAQRGEREYLWERGLRNQARPAAARKKPDSHGDTETRRRGR